MSATIQTPATSFTARCNLEEAVRELKRRLDTRSDVVADVRQMDLEIREGSVFLKALPGTALTEWLGSVDGVAMNDAALPQLFEKSAVSVPAVFGRKLIQEQPQIAEPFLRDLTKASGEKRLVRMLDGRVRAFLSDKYRCLDNFDLAAHALQVAGEVGAEPFECQLTDSHFRIKLVCRSFWDEFTTAQEHLVKGAKSMAHHFVGAQGWRGGDALPGGPGTVFPIVTLSNSETGHGGCHVSLGILHAACLNGAIISKELAAVHLGGRLSEGIMSNETRQADAKAIYLKARDILRAAFDQPKFRTMVAGLKVNAARPIEAPRAAVEQLVADSFINDEQKEAIFARWLTDYQPTVGGLSGAVSRFAQEVAEPDAVQELETLSGRILTDRKLLAGV